MLSIKSDHLQLLPHQKIIRQQAYAELVQAESIVAQAHAEANKIKQEAINVYEAEKKRGFQEGQTQAKLQMAEHMVDYVTKMVAHMHQFENRLVDMLIQALRQIIGEIDKRELILGVVAKALQVVRTQKRVMIRVAPSDLPFVEQQLNALLSQFPSMDVLDVMADNRLQPGDCMLETDVGIVDARLEQQLAIVQRSIEKWVH